MTVYVDDVRHRFRNMVMCHLWADDIGELHTFALGVLGMKMQWFQCPPKASWEHYDIALQKKALALRNGAVLTDKYGPLVHTCNLQLARPGLLPERRKLLEEKLTLITDLREKWKAEAKAECPGTKQGSLL